MQHLNRENPPRGLADRERDALANLQTYCVDKLSELARQQFAERVRRQDEVFLQVLEAIGETAHKLVHQRQITSNDCEFYFWPGYESICRPRTDRRIGPVVDFPNSTHKVHAGISYFDDCTKREEGIPFTVAAFHELLGMHIQHINKTEFTPGSTHLWAARGPRYKDTESEVSMPIQCILVSPELPTPEPVTPIHGVFHVALTPYFFLKWGGEVSARLNGRNQKYSIAANGACWPVPLETDPLGVDIQSRTSLRELLYSLWLAASFDSKTLRSGDWLDRSIAQIEEIDRDGLAPLIARIENLRSAHWLQEHHIRDNHFNRWYTIIIPPTIGISYAHDSQLLGSAMFLCSHEIDSIILQGLRRTIEVVYLNMRYLEAATIYEQQALEKQQDAFAHDIKKLAGALSKGWIVPLKDYFEVSLPSDSRSELPPGLGRLITTFPHLIESWGVTPLPTCIEAIGNMMQMWSVLQLQRAFPGINARDMNLASLAHACHDRALDAMVATMLVGETGNLRNPNNAQKAHLLQTQLSTLMKHGKCDVSCDVPPLCLKEGDAVVLARLLFAILKNASQHGDPLEPISLTISRNSAAQIKIYCKNRLFDWGHESYPTDRIGKVLNVDPDTLTELSRLLSIRVPKLEEPNPSFVQDNDASDRPRERYLRKPFSSYDTIRYCAQLLRGHAEMPDTELTVGDYELTVLLSVPEDGNEASGD